MTDSPKQRKTYPRVAVVMNKDSYDAFSNKCDENGYGQSSVINALIEKWTAGKISIKRSRYVRK